MKNHIATTIWRSLGLCFCVGLIAVGQAQAITITDTGGTSGGSTGGLPLLKASITDADIGD